MKKAMWAGIGAVILILAASGGEEPREAPARTETPQATQIEVQTPPKTVTVPTANLVPDVTPEPVEVPVADPAPVTTKAPALKPVKINNTPTYGCNCSKTCTQMSSCSEAYYQLNTCGCSRRDGDSDGVPCESLCR